MIARVLMWILVLCGLAGTLFFGKFALVDYHQLRIAYAAFHSAVETGAEMKALIAAGTAQDIHRINLSADGTWVLLSAVLAVIGLHGLLVACPRHNTIQQY